MNMIVNKSDLVGYEAVDRTEVKKKALAKIVAAWESKQAKNAARFGGLGFLAVSLAACNSSSDDTTTTTTTTTTETTTPTVTALSKALGTTADVVTSTFTSADDSITATDSTLGAGDVLVDTSSTDSDTLTVTMTGATANAPSTITGIENIVYNYGSIVSTADSTIELANIIGANVTVNHTGNALVNPNGTDIDDIGTNMTVTLGTGLDSTTAADGDLAVAASATNVTLNMGASAGTIATGASVDGLTINGGTGGALSVTLGATNKNVSINSGTALGAVTIDNTSATGTSITTGYTGADTGGQTITVTNIATAASLTVGKTGTATSATTVLIGGTAATTDTATVSAPGAITFTANQGGQAVEVLSLSGNGAAATYTLTGQPLSTSFTGSQSVTLVGTQAQIAGHTTGITDSTTAGTTTVKMSDAATTADYSKIAPDVIELAAAPTGTNVLTFKDGQSIKLTGAQANAFTLDVTDGATTNTAAGTLTLDVAGTANGSTGDITVDATASSDNIATLNVVHTTAQNDFVILGGTAATIDASGAAAVTYGATTTAKALDASDMTGAVTATLTANLKSITTGSGDDVINGAAAPAASSVVNGGAGNDEYIVPNGADNTNITFSNIEVLDVTAAEGNVTFKASQLSGSSYIIDNNDANDVLAINGAGTAAHVDLSTIDLSGLSFNSTAKTLINVSSFDTSKFLSSQSFNITGSANVDTITGSANADTITSGGGADVITGGKGSDSINGGAGGDTINFQVETTAGDVITGGADNDTFQSTTDTAATAGVTKISDMDLGTSTTTKDALKLSITMVEGLTTVTDLVDTGGASAANADGTIVTITADASTVTDADLVVLSQTYANDAAALAGMKTAGSDTMVFSGALADNDAILVAYSDGTNSYIAAATMSAATTDSDDLDSVETLVELTGVSSLAALDSGDYTSIT